MNKFREMIQTSVASGASDIHLASGHPVVTRSKGTIKYNNSMQWTPVEVDSLVRKLLSPKQINTLRTRHSVDYATTIDGIRLRVNIFNETRGLGLAIRLLPGKPPTIDELNLHPSLHQICKLQSGLVLICGATGTGKTTTIAALIEEINSSRACHIITIEDPIEYSFLSKKAFIQQRELDTHTGSFERGLMDSLREDPDVIVIGELREPETMRLCINAAEAGHLVITTLHATNAEEAIYRLCNSAPPEAQNEIRYQLSSTLSWLIVQQLIYINEAKVRAPLLSILRGTQAVKSLIRENHLQQIESSIQMGKADGMFTHDRYIKEFLNTRTTFVPPARIFRPFAEISQTVPYRSSIMKDPAHGTKPTDQPRGKGEKITVEGRDSQNVEEFVSIDENAPIEELFREYER